MSQAGIVKTEINPPIWIWNQSDGQGNCPSPGREIYEKLSDDEKENIRNGLRKLENYPGKISGIKCMKGEWEGYRRIRIGGFRVIFWYDEMENTVYIDHIGPRGDIYK